MDPELNDVTTVRIAPAFERSWRVGVVIVVFLLGVLVGKPWGGDDAGVRPTDTTGIGPTLRPSGDELAFLMQGNRPYDPALFGRYEAQPRWEIWPAGYIVEMGFAGPLAVAASPSPSPSTGPSPSLGSSASAAPSATAAPTPPPEATELLDLGRAENLGVIGVNTPKGVRISGARLWRWDGARQEAVELIELEPPWGHDHFHVFGLGGPEGGLVLGLWLPSVYRLDLSVTDASTSAADVKIGLLVRGTP